MTKQKGVRYGTPDDEYLEATVENCARCGKTHDVTFRKFRRWGITCNDLAYDWWAMCPVADEPIIMRFEELPDATA